MSRTKTKFNFQFLRMPLITLHELEQMTPLFRGSVGNALARGVMHLLAVDKVNALYDRHAHLSGADFARSVLEDLEVDYEVFVDTHEVLTQLDELGEDTPFITISNHPYGHIDGLILADYFGHRSNYKMMVNQFLNRIEALAPSLIPVTPTGVERTVATTESIMGVRRALAHLRSGGALGLLPAGAISDLSLRDGCVRDREWQPAIIAFMAKAKVPILPVHFLDRNSSLFYLLGLINWRVRLLRLPSEVFNKAHRPVRLVVGTLISVEEQQQYLATHTTEEYGQWLRKRVYGI
jgi:putative hemolysin